MNTLPQNFKEYYKQKILMQKTLRQSIIRLQNILRVGIPQIRNLKNIAGKLSNENSYRP